MNGAEFIRKVRRIGRKKGVEVSFVTHRGKGSHGTLYLGDRHTVVKDQKKDLGKGLLAQMLSDLDIPSNDF